MTTSPSKRRGKYNTELLDAKVKEENGLMMDVSSEVGMDLLLKTISDETFDYQEGLKGFRIFCMLRMNKNNDIYSKATIKRINQRYRLITEREDEDCQDSVEETDVVR